jgi:ribosomal protein L15
MRIPKLRGFRNPLKVEYEVVNVGRIAALVAAGRLEPGQAEGPKAKGRADKAAPVTVNQEILRATGLVSSLKKPLKILGTGDVDVALFVVADAVSASARAKIETAGGSVQLLETPKQPLAAIGVEPTAEPAVERPTASPKDAEAPVTEPRPATKAKAPAAKAKTKAPAAEAETVAAEPDTAAAEAETPAAHGEPSGPDSGPAATGNDPQPELAAEADVTDPDA